MKTIVMTFCLFPGQGSSFKLGSTLKGKEFAPKGANAFIEELRVIEKGLKLKAAELLILKVYQFSLFYFQVS